MAEVDVRRVGRCWSTEFGVLSASFKANFPNNIKAQASHFSARRRSHLQTAFHVGRKSFDRPYNFEFEHMRNAHHTTEPRIRIATRPIRPRNHQLLSSSRRFVRILPYLPASSCNPRSETVSSSSCRANFSLRLCLEPRQKGNA